MIWLAAAVLISGTDLVTQLPKQVNTSHGEKGTVVTFLSSKCPCSASHEPVLKEIAAEFTKKGFQFIGVHSNQNESENDARDHFKKAGLPFPVVRDVDAKLADQLGALKTPHVFVYSPKGELEFQGGVDDSHSASLAEKHYLRDTLLAMSQKQPVKITQVRTLGCAIKR